MFRVILFSPPLTQKLVLKSASRPQSDWGRYSAGISPPSSALLPASSPCGFPELPWPLEVEGAGWCVGHLPASRSGRRREGLSKDRSLESRAGNGYQMAENAANNAILCLYGTFSFARHFHKPIFILSSLLHKARKARF